MTIRSVLLVDDEPDIRRVAELGLRTLGRMTVWLARDGTEAVAMARQHAPDVILLDVMMPGDDGPSVLARLRGDAATAGIPVIFMTAGAAPDDVARYVALGARGVVAKPFNPLTLAADVVALVEGTP